MPSAAILSPIHVTSATATAGDTPPIAHLIRRTGFGATSDEIAAYTSMSYEQAVDAILNYTSAPETPDSTDKILNYDPSRIVSLQQRWLWRMVQTQRPLEEKMTLFWHGHFATANSKVNNADAMWNQNELFRSHAVGNARALTQAVAKDPAMMRWLDTVTNKKGRPNENFARELFELFTLGIGHYTEPDIKEAARAFTGWEVRNNAYFFNRNQHDSGSKTVFGKTGNFGGEDIIDLAFQQPAAAIWFTTKLYRFFVDDKPSDATIQRLAAVLTANDFEIKPLLRAMFLSPEFTSQRAYHGKVKSPVEFVVGSLRQFGVEPIPQVVSVLNGLGQALFNPPNVKGWTDGPDWISASTLLTRQNFANSLASGRGRDRRPFLQPLDTVNALALSSDDDLVDYYLSALVDGDVTPQFRTELLSYLQTGNRGTGRRGWDGKVRGMLHLIMASPAYQLN